MLTAVKQQLNGGFPFLDLWGAEYSVLSKIKEFYYSVVKVKISNIRLPKHIIPAMLRQRKDFLQSKTMNGSYHQVPMKVDFHPSLSSSLFAHAPRKSWWIICPQLPTPPNFMRRLRSAILTIDFRTYTSDATERLRFRRAGQGDHLMPFRWFRFLGVNTGAVLGGLLIIWLSRFFFIIHYWRSTLHMLGAILVWILSILRCSTWLCLLARRLLTSCREAIG